MHMIFRFLVEKLEKINDIYERFLQYFDGIVLKHKCNKIFLVAHINTWTLKSHLKHALAKISKQAAFIWKKQLKQNS